LLPDIAADFALLRLRVPDYPAGRAGSSLNRPTTDERRRVVSHYQKIATVLVRFAGILAFVLGILGFLYGAMLRGQGAQLTPDQEERIASSFWYVILGLALFVASRPLGRFLGRGLE
jgi:hypothetical protein